ncbi:ABC transporter ATP-binding protein [Anaerosalibacter sp. Marseille-P3206]|uniref:ABC transporter ATP-binding protein n=1 Tax=Anaerosalibacter sp. Marseille-P3206 TaxID=1871005 RepID=UPI000984B69B|nr:dipeptide ABC transporter ATP-binding protein [Anaerosalibacter sp. Marseille-P3206]
MAERANKESEKLYEIKDLKKYFPIYGGFFNKEVGAVKALDGISLDIKRGETVGVVGESGCGKTTFGKNIMMLQKPTSGELIYTFNDGQKDIAKLSKAELFEFRKKVQMVFQDPYSSLNPRKKIFDSFDEPLKVHGYTNKDERKDIMEEMFKIVNLQTDYLYRYPHEFSGGQRQRICIARALCIKPELVICDEPVSALDVSIQAQVLNLMKEIQRKMNLTYVFIAHDLSVVQYMSDRIVVMYLGKVLEIADSRGLYDKPLHPYTQALLSAVPIPSIEKKKDRIILEGDVPSPINKPKGCAFHNRCVHCMDICKEVEPELLDYSNDMGHQVACHLYR